MVTFWLSSSCFWSMILFSLNCFCGIVFLRTVASSLPGPRCRAAILSMIHSFGPRTYYLCCFSDRPWWSFLFGMGLRPLLWLLGRLVLNLVNWFGQKSGRGSHSEDCWTRCFLPLRLREGSWQAGLIDPRRVDQQQAWTHPRFIVFVWSVPDFLAVGYESQIVRQTSH